MANQGDDTEGSAVFRQESVTPMTPTRTNGNGFLGVETSPSQPIMQMKRNVSYGNLGTQTEARVLVLYTGGTIGMLRNEKNGELRNIF